MGAGRKSKSQSKGKKHGVKASIEKDQAKGKKYVKLIKTVEIICNNCK